MFTTPSSGVHQLASLGGGGDFLERDQDRGPGAGLHGLPWTARQLPVLVQYRNALRRRLGAKVAPRDANTLVRNVRLWHLAHISAHVRFAEQAVGGMNAAEIAVFERLIDVPDPAIETCVLEGTSLGEHDLDELIDRVRRFHGLAAAR
jgi:Flavinator of succinate dehydrogenase